jgi:LmbE family N-acetylglucosaminyl deacetylase
MIIDKLKKALVLAPHTDDGELGCGGTISKLLQSGVEVYYAAFSSCEKSVPKEFPKDILTRELKEATKELGIVEENLFLYKYDVRTFNFHRQEILDDMIKLKNQIQPDMIFIPSLNDVHQDHSTIAKEAIRAFKFCSILCYELPWNNFSFSNTYFSELSEIHVNKKITAIGKYKSQAHRTYANENYLKSLATTRGVQIGKEYAEVFEVVRIIN